MDNIRIDKEFIKRVAENARLDLSEDEIKEFVPQFKELLENFSVLDKLDTKGVDASMQPVPLKNVMREDKIEPSLSQEEALENTKHKKDGYFKGPRIV